MAADGVKYFKIIVWTKCQLIKRDKISTCYGTEHNKRRHVEFMVSYLQKDHQMIYNTVLLFFFIYIEWKRIYIQNGEVSFSIKQFNE